jgi:hypothetical protein
MKKITTVVYPVTFTAKTPASVIIRRLMSSPLPATRQDTKKAA